MIVSITSIESFIQPIMQVLRTAVIVVAVIVLNNVCLSTSSRHLENRKIEGLTPFTNRRSRIAHVQNRTASTMLVALFRYFGRWPFQSCSASSFVIPKRLRQGPFCKFQDRRGNLRPFLRSARVKVCNPHFLFSPFVAVGDSEERGRILYDLHNILCLCVHKIGLLRQLH